MFLNYLYNYLNKYYVYCANGISIYNENCK